MRYLQVRMLARKRQPFSGNSRCQQAFDVLKRLYTTVPILAYADFIKPVKLHTDACGSGLGAVLYQTHEDGIDAVIAYAVGAWARLIPTTQHIIWNFLPQVGGSQKITWILVWVNFWCVHRQESPDLHAYNSQAGCSQSLLGHQLGQLQFPVVLLSQKDKHRCRCLIEGVLARRCAWQLRYSSQSHSCSSVSCARRLPSKVPQVLSGIQLQPAHSGYSPGQSVGCLYDLGRLVSNSARRSNPKSGHL